jgi:hypothetical protein
MLINGQFIKDWDKSQMCTAYYRTQQHKWISWDMERLQDALLWGTRLRPTLIDHIKMIGFVR